MKSKLMKLNKRDWLNGLLMTVLGAVMGTVLPTIQGWLTSSTWEINIDWHSTIKLAIGAALTYLLKNFLSSSDGKFLGTEIETKPSYTAPNDATT